MSSRRPQFFGCLSRASENLKKLRTESVVTESPRDLLTCRCHCKRVVRLYRLSPELWPVSQRFCLLPCFCHSGEDALLQDGAFELSERGYHSDHCVSSLCSQAKGLASTKDADGNVIQEAPFTDLGQPAPKGFGYGDCCSVNCNKSRKSIIRWT